MTGLLTRGGPRARVATAPGRVVLVAHGTRHAPGNQVARSLAAQVGARLGVPTRCAYVELSEPLLTDVLAQPSQGSTVVVPLLLSTGYHVRHDLPAAVAGAAPGSPAALAPALGPHPLLAAAQADRLRGAGARPGAPVVMVAAGSRDPAAAADLDAAAALLADAWGGPVRLATLSGPGPRPADVLTPGAAVSPYLLAAGHFADRCRAESVAAGATGAVADVLGAHPLLVDLVVARVEDQARLGR
ncbi:sirohydrochlorin chelatase [Nocardioides sp. zg-DK7169]|uniref:sirohydrochlorin chelatase n=1 Tax=Nocardioides sp. zg-DK7169 TaxID=2736600 RepID=UPI001554422D|nr:CbiX/SirB N-terminal domain-containing protein [Nocardioides sp. zg-DK7169]NPC98254.1 sirohydrochlorin chelatase [Nocardioides sp. zg-DK7169]